MTAQDILQHTIRAVRLTGAVQFRLSVRGAWQTGTGSLMDRFALTPGRAVPFHIVSLGGCWATWPGGRAELSAGDLIAFPFAAPHDLGLGEDGLVVDPASELPPPPWQALPTLERGSGTPETRILCGFFYCSAFGFAPLVHGIPAVLVTRSAADPHGWLAATAAEIDRELQDGPSPLAERLVEAMFVQMLRQNLAAAGPGVTGWLAAAADPVVGRCLTGIHDRPGDDWTLAALARAAGASPSSLTARFHRLLGMTPMRYVRTWRLHLAARALRDGTTTIADAAFAARYNSEAAFTRAFAAEYGQPPARWREAS
ncbi:helix-turn-helix domain-containing protein [Rhodobacterales bacterium HKCCE2091]|nr:helix-turn-helix domain-containing protein [Rhodobacterales bacterium HKCCE2091]